MSALFPLIAAASLPYFPQTHWMKGFVKLINSSRHSQHPIGENRTGRRLKKPFYRRIGGVGGTKLLRKRKGGKSMKKLLGAWGTGFQPLLHKWAGKTPPL
jgi:hypothetical protein